MRTSNKLSLFSQARSMLPMQWKMAIENWLEQPETGFSFSRIRHVKLLSLSVVCSSIRAWLLPFCNRVPSFQYSTACRSHCCDARTKNRPKKPTGRKLKLYSRSTNSVSNEVDEEDRNRGDELIDPNEGLSVGAISAISCSRSPRGEEIGETTGEAIGEIVGEAIGEIVGEAIGEIVGEIVGDPKVTEAMRGEPAGERPCTGDRVGELEIGT